MKVYIVKYIFFDKYFKNVFIFCFKIAIIFFWFASITGRKAMILALVGYFSFLYTL